MLRRTRLQQFACCQLAFLQNTQSTYSPAAANNSTEPVSIRPDTIFEAKATQAKFGLGALNEIGRDTRNLFGAKRIAIITDENVSKLDVFLEFLHHIGLAKVDIALYNKCRVEPTDQSFIDCGQFLAQANADCMVSIGGGSVMDTAKAGSLLAAHKEDTNFDLMPFVNAPIGQGRTPSRKLMPHIACPSTVGTGSECTPHAICDVVQLKLKTGVSFPALVPNIACVDPRLSYTLPSAVIAASAFDILCHAAESLTARPFTERLQAFPQDPTQRVVRPSANGSNPYADFGCIESLRLLGLNYRDAFHAPKDKPNHKALYQLTLASMIAGTAFGNVGVHIPHSNSYSLSGLCRPEGYKAPCCYPQYDDHPVLAHGFAVALTAPSTFRAIGEMNDVEMNRRLVQAAQNLRPDLDAKKDFPDYRSDDGVACGDSLAKVLIDIMKQMDMPNGIGGAGFTSKDIPALVKGSMLQKRLLNNAPFDVEQDHLTRIFEGAQKYW